MSVVMLAGRGTSTWIVANALQSEIGLDAVILESPPSRWQVICRRANRLGWPAAMGQLLFSLYATRLRARSANRSSEIMRENCLQAERPQGLPVFTVASANDGETLELLRRLSPKVVVVNGTRILSRVLLEGVDAAFLNMHVGITPKYRGVHGGYWALANCDAPNAGVTVHLVNPGIDTGGILYQSRIQPQPQDNFVTYPLLQLAAGLPLLVQAVRDALAGEIQPRPTDLPSHLYYPPTLWQYWWTRLRLGVK